MKKYSWIILLVTLSAISVIIYLYSSNSKQNSDYSAEKSNSNSNSGNFTNSNTNNLSTVIPKTPVENELSIYSTIIKNQRDSNRQGNISITCSALNNTIVKPRRNFFFLRYCWSIYRRTRI